MTSIPLIFRKNTLLKKAIKSLQSNFVYKFTKTAINFHNKSLLQKAIIIFKANQIYMKNKESFI